MIDFKLEHQKYSQIIAIEEVLKDFRAYDIIRQAHIDLMYYFNSFYEPKNGIILDRHDAQYQIHIKEVYIGYQVPYSTIIDKVTDLWIDNQIKAEFEKTYTLNNVKFCITSYQVAEIPQEDLLLLELLGKVSVKLTPAQPSKVTKTIFCLN